MTATRSKPKITQLVLAAIGFATCWAALTDNRGWWFFLPLCALLLLWWHLSDIRLPAIRLRAIPRFLLFFSKQLVLGATDVGWRALSPQPQFAPRWQYYPLSLTDPASQRILASMISLLPGTCSAQIEYHQQEPNKILLHVLDQQADWRGGIAALEQQLAQLLDAEPKAIEQ